MSRAETPDERTDTEADLYALVEKGIEPAATYARRLLTAKYGYSEEELP